MAWSAISAASAEVADFLASFLAERAASAAAVAVLLRPAPAARLAAMAYLTYRGGVEGGSGEGQRGASMTETSLMLPHAAPNVPVVNS